MLNEVEKSFLTQFVEQDEMVNAVRKAVLIEIQNTFPTFNPSDNDEVIGQRARAFTVASALLDKVLLDLRKYKGRKNINNKDNLER